MPESVKIDFGVQGMDKVKALIELLDKHRDSLPSDLVASIDDLADCDEFEYSHENVNMLGFDTNVVATCDGVKVLRVFSINVILKRVRCYAKSASAVTGEIYPKTFSLSDSSGKTKVFW